MNVQNMHSKGSRPSIITDWVSCLL